jgi:membrane-bound metal-dependent hydrolase YbcI (DUF457 family)
VPLPVAHGLVGATVVAALLPSSQSRLGKPLLIGAFLAVSPDFDYALNWLRVSGGGWHHGFTHSIPFALVIGLVTVIALRDSKPWSFFIFSAAFAAHTLLDYILTESRGVALWWPFTNHRYKLRLPNPIDYAWSDDSLWATTVDILKISLSELAIFAPLLLVILLVRRVLMKRSRLRQSLQHSISLFVVVFLYVSPAFSQDKQRIVHWREVHFTPTSSTFTVVGQIEALEIIDVRVGDKSITLGESFAADDEWLKSLTFRVKNVSSTSISKAQLNLFLPQIMPGGPMVTLCYGCGDIGRGQSIAPGEEVEMKIVFYSWLLGQITSRSNLSGITRAEIQEMLVTIPDRKTLFSTCIKTASRKNACVPATQ